MTTTAPPIVDEGHHSPHRGHSESGRGGHGVLHHGHGHVLDVQQPLKTHHQHEDGTHNPMPDFERQLAHLKEDPGSSVDSGRHNSHPVHDEEMPIEPQSRKDGLFTPGLGVEEVSFLGPIRRPGEEDEEKDEDDLSEARPLDVPLQPDLLESEADVLEELKKLSALHDRLGPSHLEAPTRTPFKVEEPSGTGIGGATEDHSEKPGEEEDPDDEESENKGGEESEDSEEDEESNDEDEEDEDEDMDEETTDDPAKEVASLEERLSVSLRKLAERRKQAQKAIGVGEVKGSASAPSGYQTHSAAGRTEMGYSPSGTSSGYYATGSGPGTAPETASGSAPGTAPSASGDTSPGTYPGVPRTYPIGGDLTSSAPISSPELLPSYDANVEKGDEGSRAVMKKAHMARKLMDPEDPKKDEDLLELMLRIAESPDEWKRVHHLLRQLDDDLTTYEKTMHRVEALALEKSSGRGEGKKGRKKPLGEKEEEEDTDAEQRRQEMSQSGLPAGSHGENLSSTTQQPLQPSAVATSAATHHGSHKDWPRFAYHRVTTAPHPYFLQQQQKQQQEGQGAPQGTHHRNAYIAVSVITPPKGRHGGMSRPLPSPPPVYAVSPTPESPYQRPPPVDGPPVPDTRPPQPRLMVEVGGRDISEETIREPMEEDVVESVAKSAARGRHHKTHSDPIEEQLRTLADVEAKFRHHLREKERMRQILKEAGKGENVDEHIRSKRRAKRSTNIRQHRPNGLILLKTS